MPIIIPYEQAPQGSDDWLNLRKGIPTSSQFSKIITTKGIESKQRSEYLKILAAERVTGIVVPKFKTADMKLGTLMEPESRLHFENTFNVEVEQVAVVFKDERRRFLCSPDGILKGLKEGFETKSANPFLQRDRLQSQKLPMEHYAQVMGSLYICEFDIWHFRSYCRGMRPLDIKVYRDESWIKKLKIELEIFSDELDAEVENLRKS